MNESDILGWDIDITGQPANHKHQPDAIMKGHCDLPSSIVNGISFQDENIIIFDFRKLHKMN